ARQDLGQIGARALDGRSVSGSLAHRVGDLRAPDLVLAGQTVDIGAGAADPPALDDDDLASRLSQVPRQQLASLPAPEDEHLDPLRLRHHRLLSVCSRAASGILVPPLLWTRVHRVPAASGNPYGSRSDARTE